MIRTEDSNEDVEEVVEIGKTDLKNSTLSES